MTRNFIHYPNNLVILAAKLQNCSEIGIIFDRFLLLCVQKAVILPPLMTIGNSVLTIVAATIQTNMIARFIISALAVWITAWTLDGVTVEPWWAALLVAAVLGLINTFIRPIVKFFSLPINILTLGLFTLVINALMVMLCSWMMSNHFKVEGFLWALAFSIVMALVNWVLSLFVKK